MTMPHGLRAGLAGLGLLACTLAANAGEIQLVGKGAVPGSASDLSGLTGEIYDAADSSAHVPQNILGGFGSGVAYTGIGDYFVAVSDRGPFDGVTDPAYADRFHIFRFALNIATKTVTPTLTDTRLLRNRVGESFVGLASAFDTAQPWKTMRFDPEGVRVSRDGSLFISDEYGPYIYEFTRRGRLLRKLPLPNRYLIDSPSADANLELSLNTKGRQANRGMEGLAIAPDGRALFGLMQNPLIQDGGLDSNLKRAGVNSRLIKISLVTGKVEEFVYQIEAGNGSKHGMNEITAVNDHQFLVVERDGKAGEEAATKKIYLIDISGATDVSKMATLPSTCTTGVDCPFTPVSKTLLVDMLAAEYGLQGPDFPEKIEALAFGPDLADGRHVLYVFSDNDLNPDRPSMVFAFAIPAAVLPGYEPQKFGLSFFSDDAN